MEIKNVPAVATRRVLSTARLSFPLASAIAALFASQTMHAANIWDGGAGTGSWNTLNNWDNNLVPLANATLTFAGNVQGSTTNDTTADRQYNGFLFTNTGAANNTGAFTLAGNRITLGGNITTTANTAGTTITDSISLDMILNGNRTITTNQQSATVQHNLNISGIISSNGTFGLTKTGAGNLTLSGANTYNGTTTLGTAGSLTSGGLLTVSGAAGTINASSGYTINGFGSKLLLDNTLGNVDRLKNASGVTLNLGGELSLTGNGTNNSTETIASLALGTGSSIVTVASATGRVSTLELTGGISRTNLSTALVRGTSLDQSASTNVSRITLGTAPTGADFVGTNTLTGGATNNSTQALKIVPWLFGATTPTGTGSNFVTYDSTLGLRVLTNAQMTTLAAGSTTAANPVNALAFNGIVTTPGLTVNSLLFNTNSHTLNGSGNLTVNSGAVASVATLDVIGSGFSSLALGNGEGVITSTSGSLTINTPINVTNSGGLTKTGGGTVVLGASNLYTGQTTVNQGVLQIGTGTAGDLGSNAANIVLNGGHLSFGRTDAGLTLANTISGSGTVTQNGAGGTTVLSGANTYTGETIVSTGTLTLTGNRTVNTTGGYTVYGAGTQTLNIQNGNYGIGGSFIVGNSGGTATVNHTAGTISSVGVNGLLLGNGSNAGTSATYNLSGGSLTSSSIVMGVNDGFSATNLNTSTIAVSGGNLTATTLRIGHNNSISSFNTSNTFTQTGGGTTITNLSLGGNSARATDSTGKVIANLNLTGGNFTATTFSSLSAGGNTTSSTNANSSTINIGGTAQVTLGAFPTARGTNSTANITFDTTAGGGGYLEPVVASTTYMPAGTFTNAFLTANGANFNVVGGKDITIGQALQNASGAAGALTKTGNGTLTLSGNNTYTGVTTLRAGNLSVSTIGDGGVLGNLGQATSNATNLVFAGGGLSYTGGNASSNRNFTLIGTDNTTNTIGVSTLGTTLTLAGTSPSIVSTNNSSSGLLQKTGNGHLVLDPGAGVSYSLGSIEANGGNLTLKSGNFTTTSVNPLIGYTAGAGTRGGGTLVVDGANLTVNTNHLKLGAAGNGDLRIVSGTVTAPDIVVGHNGISVATQSGGNVTTNNLYHYHGGTGSYTMTGGNLTVKSIYNLPNSNETFTFRMDGGTVKAAVGTTNLITTGGNLSGPQVAVQLGSTNGGATIDTSLSSATIQRPLDNMSGQAGRLTKIGNNTLFLSGNNTYTGVTTINAGTLSVTTIGNGGEVGNLGQATADAANLVLAGGTLSYTGDTATSNRSFTLSGTTTTTNTIAVATLGKTLTLTGNLPNTNNGNSGLLQKSGSGNLVLDPGMGGNYTVGSLSANDGSLTLKSGNFTTTSEDPNIADFDVGAGARLGGTLVVDGANLTVSMNRLKVGATSTGNLSIVSGTVTAPDIVVGHNGSSVATQSGGNVTTNNLYHYDGGTGSYTMTGGNLTVRRIYNFTAGSETFTFRMDGGTVRAAAETSSLFDNAARGGAELAVQLGSTGARIDTSLSNATIARPMGDMSGQAGRLTKIGNNTLTLNATNTYTGDTIVSGGTLRINGANSGNGAVIVAAGTSFGGSGSVIGGINVSGFLSPGDSATSIESFRGGALSFGSTSTYAYQLQTLGLTGDLAHSTSTLTIATGAILSLTDLSAGTGRAEGDKLTLISSVGAWNGGLFKYDSGTGTATTLGNGSVFRFGTYDWMFKYDDTAAGSNFVTDTTGASNFVTMTVVPEPNVAAVLGGICTLLLLRRRRA